MVLQDITDIQESHKWLSWKILPKGTYLSVIPEFLPSDWNIEDVRKTLIINCITNFDISKIETVIKNTSTEMELIGPPFEVFDHGKRRYLRLQVTPIQVRFSVDVNIFKTDLNITKDDVLFMLSEKSVTYGIDHDVIGEIISKNIYGPEFIIAAATPPVMGMDAVVKEIIPVDPDVKPFLDENGNVDYKKWDNIRQVKKDEVICVRTPPTPGIPGTSVFGHHLSPSPGEDFALPAGINTKIIDDETKLVASINGFLYRSGRDICVGNIYIINEDVSVKTGNIEYSGDVLIRGCVNAGFSVIADGNISIDGFVEAAHIESRKNNVFLKGSVFGLNKATIIAEKNISAENIQDARIRAGKNLLVNGQIRGCKIEAENLEMPSKGSIASSIVAFKGRVSCGIAGGKSETLNEFMLIENEREQFKEELQKINELLQKLNNATNSLQYKILALKNSSPSPEKEEQKKLLASQLSTCNYNKEKLAEKRNKTIRLIEVLPDRDGLIIIRRLSPTLKVSIFGIKKEFKQELKDLKISWKGGMIKMESL